MSVSRNFELTNPSPVTQTIGLVNLSKLPPSFSLKDTLLTIGSGGVLTQPLTIQTNPIANGGPNEYATVTIPAGSKFVDEIGNPILGKLKVSVVYSSPKGVDDYNAFPGGIDNRQFYDTLGNKLFVGTIIPKSYVNYDLEFINQKKPPASGVNGLNIAAIFPNLIGDEFGFTIQPTNIMSESFDNDLRLTGVILDKKILGYGIAGSMISPPCQTDGTLAIAINAKPENILNYDFSINMRSKGFPNTVSTKEALTFTENIYIYGPYNRCYEYELVYKNKITGVADTVKNITGVHLITLPNTPKEKYMAIKFAVTCPDNTRLVLEPNTEMYIIEEALYDVTIRPNGANKIFPQDKPINGVSWAKYNTGPIIIENGKSYSTIKIPVRTLKTNTTYRVSTMYGNIGRIDNDQNQPLITPAAFPGTSDYDLTIDMDSPKCQ